MIDASTAVDLCRQTLISAVIIAAPLLLVGMAAGLAIGLLQALTQVQDQTVAFVPKLLSMAAIMIACMPWLINRMVEFTRVVFENAGSP
ncbi:flagellar biosynthetic protein FliQ [Novipirellula artificiosorum]|uniref:Flagellar biosynthetic protein FliQ n=1 Tax=Novipirellula artificiosorum TaxID=2528016 RepID=A0A5C6DZY8_9BACT|nr:flagellar biosynthetic protein FliQ [Novipirellula artificiosorum]TWU42208.1 Flagellar biosynthetic protein FliQ [Novipirellula artificiosorum]